jgi:hypothetical protein
MKRVQKNPAAAEALTEMDLFAGIDDAHRMMQQVDTQGVPIGPAERVEVKGVNELRSMVDIAEDLSALRSMEKRRSLQAAMDAQRSGVEPLQAVFLKGLGVPTMRDAKRFVRSALNQLSDELKALEEFRLMEEFADGVMTFDEMIKNLDPNFIQTTFKSQASEEFVKAFGKKQAKELDMFSNMPTEAVVPVKQVITLIDDAKKVERIIKRQGSVEGFQAAMEGMTPRKYLKLLEAELVQPGLATNKAIKKGLEVIAKSLEGADGLKDNSSASKPVNSRLVGWKR